MSKKGTTVKPINGLVLCCQNCLGIALVESYQVRGTCPRCGLEMRNLDEMAGESPLGYPPPPLRPSSDDQQWIDTLSDDMIEAVMSVFTDYGFKYETRKPFMSYFIAQMRLIALVVHFNKLTKDKTV